ncbi:5-formyltetrahydrofolate cyclo-ligase [Paenibacillus sp. FA6]|uniref:5-formyltetrahydrofolate cyclo-ligase n=1 Tax=Paenibacillus sp. FA6 TaxID=3413029 RepID=UPI003F65F739
MNGNNPPLSIDKRTMRLRLTEARNELSKNECEQWSNEAVGYIIEELETMGIANFLVYIPFRSELNTRPLIEWGWNKGLEVLVPRCDPSNYSMEMYPLRDWNELSPGAYGIEEPDPLRTTAVGYRFVPEAIVLPGLAFDRTGGRLGYGSGYYDRLYERLQPWIEADKPPILIGLGYNMQIVDKVPMDEHDAALNMLVTEKGIVDCG